MFNVVFYEDSNGVSELYDFIYSLSLEASTSKDARIQHNQISLCIKLLKQYGSSYSKKIIKRLDEDIYELRPGNNRILFFYFKDNTYVLLHHFRKKTRKTPPQEIAKAKRERNDWIKRKG